MGKTFLEMLEEVPPLLHECVSALAADMISDTEAECNLSDYHINHDQAFHEGIAQFRNISKKASQIGLQAVSGYCMRLTPQLKHRELGKYHEPLIHHLKVAKLLCRANIQRLRVEVEVFKGSKSRHDIIHQTEQLQAFISDMGPALSTVTSLELKVCEIEHRSRKTLYNDIRPKRETHTECYWDPPELSTAGSSGISTKIATACPLIKHLGMAGGVGLPPYRIFGTLCNNLTSWELLDAGTPFSTLKTIISEKLLPKVTHIKLFQPRVNFQARGCAVLICASQTLSHFSMASSLMKEQTWRCLPSKLESLHILGYTRFPLELPIALQLGKLKHLILSKLSSTVHILFLAGILSAAPKLQSVELHDASAGSRKQTGFVLSISSCTPQEVQASHVLAQRIEAGFQLNGVLLCLNSHPRFGKGRYGRDKCSSTRPDALHVRDLLHRLPCLPGVRECKIQDDESSSDHERYRTGTLGGSGANAGSLSHIARILPDLEDLDLRWLCEDHAQAAALLQEFRVGKLVVNIIWEGLSHLKLDNVIALAEVIIKTPSLQQLTHDACMGLTSAETLREMLHEAHNMAAVAAAANAAAEATVAAAMKAASSTAGPTVVAAAAAAATAATAVAEAAVTAAVSDDCKTFVDGVEAEGAHVWDVVGPVNRGLECWLKHGSLLVEIHEDEGYDWYNESEVYDEISE